VADLLAFLIASPSFADEIEGSWLVKLNLGFGILVFFDRVGLVAALVLLLC
jgi:hypothetical protein